MSEKLASIKLRQSKQFPELIGYSPDSIWRGSEELANCTNALRDDNNEVARRFVASWNECAGIMTEDLEEGEIQKIRCEHAEYRRQRDTAWQELREIREAIKADENESTADEVRLYVHRHDVISTSLFALEDISTAVEADIDAGRPLEYNVDELRAELIRARKALGMLPEQEQTTTLGMEPSP